jgi:hypothetical protein
MKNIVMKRILLFAGATIALAACHNGPQEAQNSATPATQSFFGSTFDPAGAVAEPEMVKMIGDKDSVAVKFSTNIIETCQMAGCWMTVQSSSGYPMWVYMKDHEFSVPKSGAAELKCVVSGIAYHDTLSVEDLKHYAEDANKSQAEIDAITSPLPVLAVDATGVMIENFKPTDEKAHEGEHKHDHSEEEHGH